MGFPSCSIALHTTKDLEPDGHEGERSPPGGVCWGLRDVLCTKREAVPRPSRGGGSLAGFPHFLDTHSQGDFHDLSALDTKRNGWQIQGLFLMYEADE